MALRVLLADESATIKKVMQLSLQDYSVDLKTVSLGVDVLEVARNFQPDIIFMDILLQKKNGYEVCRELKSTPDLAKIPVVLLWNSFMEVDEKKLQEAKPNERLEKPFDAATLRGIVMRLVPKLQTNPLASHAEVPDLPELTIVKKMAQAKKEASPLDMDFDEKTKAAPPQKGDSDWSMESFEDIPKIHQEEMQNLPSFSLEDEQEEKFQSMPLKNLKAPKEATSPSLQKFQLDIPETEVSGFGGQVDVPEEPVNFDTSNFLWSPEDAKKTSHAPTAATVPSETKTTTKITPPLPAPPKKEDFLKELEEVDHEEKDFWSREKAPGLAGNKTAAPTLSEEQIVDIIRSQSQEVIERIARQIIPDIAKAIIQKEIEKIIHEVDL